VYAATFGIGMKCAMTIGDDPMTFVVEPGVPKAIDCMCYVSLLQNSSVLEFAMRLIKKCGVETRSIKTT